MLKELLLSLSFLQSPDMLLAQQIETTPSTTPAIVREINTLRQESILPTATDRLNQSTNIIQNNYPRLVQAFRD